MDTPTSTSAFLQQTNVNHATLNSQPNVHQDPTPIGACSTASLPTPKKHKKRKKRDKPELLQAALDPNPRPGDFQYTQIPRHPLPPRPAGSSSAHGPVVPPQNTVHSHSQPPPPPQPKGAPNPPRSDLKISIFQGFPIKTDCKFTKRAAGECIIRAVIQTLSRKFNYISKEEFVDCYQALFDSEEEKAARYIAILDSKMFRNIIESSTQKSIKYYRLNPVFFSKAATDEGFPEILDPNNLTANLPTNSMGRIYPLPLKIVMRAVQHLDAQCIAVGENFQSLCPRVLSYMPSRDLQRYQCFWHPTVIWSPDEATLGAANSALSLNLWVFGEDITLVQYAMWYLRGSGTGMEAKRARNFMEKHANRVLKPLEKERQQDLKAMLSEDLVSSSFDIPTDSQTSSSFDHSVTILEDDDDGGESGQTESSQTPRAPNHRPSISIDLTIDDAASSTSSSPSGPTLFSAPQWPIAPATPLLASHLLNRTIPSRTDHQSTQNITGTWDLTESMDITEDDMRATGMASDLPTQLYKDKASVKSEPEILELLAPKYPKHVIDVAELTKTPNVTKDTASRVHEKSQEPETVGPVTQASRLKTMLKQQRFKPYPGSSGSDSTSGSNKSGPGKTASSQPKRGDGKRLGFIPPLGDGVFTLPRPILPSVDTQPMPLSEMTGQLLGTSRDQILKMRREALDSIIDYTKKMPLWTNIFQTPS